ncbi:MAG: hypothetical protein AAGA83_25735 [Cyanobacteria bacterium P01_F01_bin.116]
MKAKYTLITTIPLLLLVGGCGDIVADVINSITDAIGGEVANATGQETGLMAHGHGPGPDAFQMVGSTGQLSEGQINQLLHLSWPQSHQAITTALGTPHTRDTHADYYQMPNGHTATVYYSGSGNATGYSLGDSGAE